jgi:hypothetical protein
MDLLLKKKADLSTVICKKNDQALSLPGFLERCYLISFYQYLSVLDAYYYNYKIKSVDKEKKFSEYFSKFNKTNLVKSLNIRIAQKVKSKYFWVYYVLYYFKIVREIRFDDSFFYALYFYLDVPPAIVIYIKKHAHNYMKMFKKKKIDISLFEKSLKEKIGFLEEKLGFYE